MRNTGGLFLIFLQHKNRIIVQIPAVAGHTSRHPARHGHKQCQSRVQKTQMHHNTVPCQLHYPYGQCLYFSVFFFLISCIWFWLFQDLIPFSSKTSRHECLLVPFLIKPLLMKSSHFCPSVRLQCRSFLHSTESHCRCRQNILLENTLQPLPMLCGLLFLL